MDPVLEALCARSAITSGRPRLTAYTASEAELLRIRARIEAALGPLPQADVVEPFDPSDPADPWELRIDLPGLDPARAERLPAGLRWSVADSPGLTEALDRGWLHAEPLAADGLVARWLVDPEGDRRPDLARREVPVEVPLTGLGRVVGVVHRPSGRWGWELTTDDADPAAVLAEVAALARADGRLAPDPEWELRGGALVLRVWAVGPLAPGLPGEVAWPEVPAEQVAAWLADLPGAHEEVEIQVLPDTPADHDRLVDALAPLAAREGWHGGRPRWVRTARGVVFAPTWRAAALDPAVLRALPAARVVPGEPVGLGERWAVADPSWRVAGERCFLRIADPVRDRDLLEPVEDRPADRRDHLVADAIPYDVRPYADPDGRPGLEVVGDRATLGEEGLARLLAAAGAVRHPDLRAVGRFGFARDGARVRISFRS